MKLATSVDQSKKLSEILPIESSDMHYVRKTRTWDNKPFDGEFGFPKYGNPNSKHAQYVVQNFSSYETIPAWSLSALFVILKDKIETNDDTLFIDIIKEDELYSIGYHSIWDKDDFKIETKAYEDFIDASYEMILKLKEMKLI